jgi:hypothetical protein
MQSPVKLPSAHTSLVSCGPGGLVWSAALDKSSQGRRCDALVRNRLQTTRWQIEWKVELCWLERSSRLRGIEVGRSARQRMRVKQTR